MVELNLAEVHEALALRIPDRECLVYRDRRFTWSDVTDRTRRVANALLDRGLGQVVPRSQLAGHESGQDHVACYLHNGNEYLETMLGSFKARTVPVNVNYRYVADELTHLLTDSKATAIVYHSRFAPVLDQVRAGLPELRVLLQVEDESRHPLLDGAEWYETALADASPERPDLEWSPDDLYILYTGGTTGLPKGVLWRQADVAVAAFSIRNSSTGREFGSLEQLVDQADADTNPMRFLPAPPFMHGAGHWNAFSAWGRGSPVIVQGVTDRFDPADVLATIERERVNFLLIVGDAYAQPLLDELERGEHDLTSLQILLSGGAPLAAPRKAAFLEHLPDVTLIDGVGSSEAGGQLRQVTTKGEAVSTGTFRPDSDTVVVDADMTRVLPPGDDSGGWLAKRGRIPLGYLGDAEKSARTFPTIDGIRHAVPGDRAVYRADGIIELRGRESVTINTGGEKVFAEEVEAAISQHPDVYDVVVAGRPSDRWGQEVVAIVRLRRGSVSTRDDLMAVAGRHLARYKLPKEVILRDEIVRSPAGKADYRWARAVATGEQ